MTMQNKDIINVPGRKRSKNYTAGEEVLLVELVDAYKNYIENKKSDAVTWKEKEEAWKKIGEEFAASIGTNRHWKALRDKYEMIKRKSKSEMAQQKIEMYRTGGGVGSAEVSTVSAKIASMLGDSAAGLQNIYDSDSSVIKHGLSYVLVESSNESSDQKQICGENNDNSGGTAKDKTDWSSWKPKTLKEPKSKELVLGGKRKRNLEEEKIKLILLQQKFYRDENIRAQEKHEQELLCLKLKNEILQLELAEKKKKHLNKVNTSIFVLKDEIYSPNIEYSSEKLDQILFSLLVQQAMKLDASYVESLTSDLANNKRPKNSDFMAFDIQRGRDHGLQPYFKYLETCNQIKINDWKDLERFIMTEDLNNLKTAYYSWHNIDLIVGGVSEIPVKNAILGPTFQCIFGEQFLKLRQWDQSDIDPADEDYLKWKFVTAADLLCINSNLQYVPSNIFKIPSETNLMVNCSDRLQKLNLNGNY